MQGTRIGISFQSRRKQFCKRNVVPTLMINRDLDRIVIHYVHPRRPSRKPW